MTASPDPTSAPPTSPDEVEPTVAALIEDLFGVPADDLGPDVRLADGLQLDSLSVVELQVAIEDAFDVRFTDAQTDEVETYGQLLTVVRDTVVAAAATPGR